MQLTSAGPCRHYPVGHAPPLTLPPTTTTTTTTTTAPAADPGSQAAATIAAQAWLAQAMNNCATQNGGSPNTAPSQIQVVWDPDGPGGPGFVADEGGTGRIGEASTGATAEFDATFENGTRVFTLLNANVC